MLKSWATSLLATRIPFLSKTEMLTSLAVIPLEFVFPMIILSGTTKELFA